MNGNKLNLKNHKRLSSEELYNSLSKKSKLDITSDSNVSRNSDIFSSSELAKMSADISNYYFLNKQSTDLYNKKMQLRDALFLLIKTAFPNSGLYIVGSSHNGFGDKNSDMDLCLMITQHNVDQKSKAVQYLRTLENILRRCSFVKKIQLIKAKVPIIKCVDIINKIECDLNINNKVGIRNTHLLNMYSKVEPRVAPLVLFIKRWAKHHNINDASKCTISSYSLALLVIHFLQCSCKPPVLPSLQMLYPEKFLFYSDVRCLSLTDDIPKYESKNCLSMGQLFFDFLQYYAHEFNHEKEVISIRLGKTISRETAIKECQNSTERMWQNLGIVEPFEYTNTARSVYDQQIFLRILRVFRKSCSVLKQTKDTSELFMGAF